MAPRSPGYDEIGTRVWVTCDGGKECGGYGSGSHSPHFLKVFSLLHLELRLKEKPEERKEKKIARRRSSPYNGQRWWSFIGVVSV